MRKLAHTRTSATHPTYTQTARYACGLNYLLVCVRVCAQVSATAGLSVHYCVRSVVMSGSVASLLVLCVRVCVIECPARVYVRGCVLRACIRISEDVCLFAWELACLSDCFTSFPDRPACRPACLHNSICLAVGILPAEVQRAKQRSCTQSWVIVANPHYRIL